MRCSSHASVGLTQKSNGYSSSQQLVWTDVSLSPVSLRLQYFLFGSDRVALSARLPLGSGFTQSSDRSRTETLGLSFTHVAAHSS